VVLSRACVIAVIAAGCGRVGFTSLDDDPRLQLHVTFESSLDDVAQERSVTCLGPCPALEEGDTSMAATFNGTQCLAIPSAPAFVTQDFTLAVWFRNAGAVVHTMFGKPLDGATGRKNSYQLWMASDTVFVTTSAVAVTATATVPDMDWHHVAATYASGEVQLFLDGVVQMANTVPLTSHDSGELFIGCDVDVGAPFGFWNGQLDDVRYYSRALFPSEISALAE
jgi:hypothetical protein